jgi:hypothetical protein
VERVAPQVRLLKLGANKINPPATAAMMQVALTAVFQGDFTGLGGGSGPSA